ncbi:MAG: linear amide C-N hydrolase [Treponema sp.]|nr:linear amide C-N hydrolase [Treponema sp.]
MHRDRKKTYTAVKITAVCIPVLLVLFAGAMVIIFRDELKSLRSLEKIDDYGMFRMTYYGDYGFDDFLKTGAKNDKDIERFVTGRLLKGLPVHLNAAGAGCTAFVVHNERGDILYGRNFDFAYAPSLQVFTAPSDGYASVSTVNLSFAGYGKDTLPEKMKLNSFPVLAAPYLPFDGMNEKGVAIALLAVPEADAPYSPEKVTLNTTTIIRLVLDKAATVDEAVRLMKKYNIYFSGGITCHYLIADSTGRSALVEYYNGAVRTVNTGAAYQIASNFIAYNGVNIGEGFTEFDRYNAVKDEITRNNNQLTNLRAIALLRNIGIYDGKTDKLQWSVLYNLTTGRTALFAHRNINNIVRSSLVMDKKEQSAP